jgi:hypothetical protein
MTSSFRARPPVPFISWQAARCNFKGINPGATAFDGVFPQLAIPPTGHRDPDDQRTPGTRDDAVAVSTTRPRRNDDQAVSGATAPDTDRFAP